jgi:phosphatidylserine/phosphatidylglycerophosphate/cardiolipin synthase-like enzyme
LFAIVMIGCAVFARAEDPGPIPPGFTLPLVAAFNNNYRGPVEENRPLAKADPRNTEKYVFALINRATATLDVAFFDIADLDAVDALIRAHRRGVAVRVLTDSDNLRDKEDPTKPREATERLRKAKVPLRDDRRGAFMHHKFIVADGAAVWLGSMNLTETSIFEHNNNGLLIRSRRLASSFTAEFNRLYDESLFGGPRAPAPYPELMIGGAEVQVFFSPLGGARQALIEAITNATQSIRIMAFVFTEEAVAKAVIDRKRAGVSVEAVFDDCLINFSSQFYNFRRAGIWARRDGNQALMHHKVMVIDDDTVITGSYNFSNNAERSNNETLVIIRSRPLAQAYLEEFARLRHAAIKNRDLPPYDHPACRRGTGE